MNPTTAILKLRHVIRRQLLALATEHSYVHWLSRYISAVNAMPAALTSEQKLERFLSAMATRREVSASTQHQAFNAILFFYKHVLNRPLQNIEALRIHRPAQVRHAPSVAETRALLETVRDVAGYPTRLMARLLYGCGLRVSEPLNLRIKDLQLQESTHVHSRRQRRQGSGRNPAVVARSGNHPPDSGRAPGVAA